MILYIVHNLQKNEYRNIISVLFKRNKYCINLRKEKYRYDIFMQGLLCIL